MFSAIEPYLSNLKSIAQNLQSPMDVPNTTKNSAFDPSPGPLAGRPLAALAAPLFVSGDLLCLSAPASGPIFDWNKGHNPHNRGC